MKTKNENVQVKGSAQKRPSLNNQCAWADSRGQLSRERPPRGLGTVLGGQFCLCRACIEPVGNQLFSVFLSTPCVPSSVAKGVGKQRLSGDGGKLGEAVLKAV